MSSSISIVIPVYNGSRYLPALLASLAPQVPVERIILVDNASTDRAVEQAVAANPGLISIRLEENRGFGTACNAGIQHALDQGADWVAILNQDLTLEPDAIDQARHAAESLPRAGFVALFQLDYAGTSLDAIFRHYLPASYWDDLLLRSPQAIYEVPFVPAAAVLLRRECLLQLGGFDPLYFMYLEDRDLCHRLLKHNWKVAIATTARVHHDCGQVRTAKSFAWQLNWHRSRMIYHLKSNPRSIGLSLVTGLRQLLPHWSPSEAFHWGIAWLRSLGLLSSIAKHRQSVPAFKDHIASPPDADR